MPIASRESIGFAILMAFSNAASLCGAMGGVKFEGAAIDVWAFPARLGGGAIECKSGGCRKPGRDGGPGRPTLDKQIHMLSAKEGQNRFRGFSRYFVLTNVEIAPL
jgi:hypothetical protein